MEESDIQKRLSDLEQEVAALKTTVQPDDEAAGSTSRLRKLSEFLKANWVLLSFVSTILIALYGKYYFGVNYFEKFETAKTINELSAFHAQMGDRFMGIAEFPSAKQAYGEALKINPDNGRAVWGNALAQVFDPPPGEKNWAPEVVDAKLDYLRQHKDFGQDYRLDFLKAMRYVGTGDYQNALDAIQPCFDKPASDADKFVGCYFQRAYIEINQSNVEAATADFQKAVKADPQLPQALNNLAACQFLAADFSGAYKGFEESNRISPKLLTMLNLGEADWYLRDFAAALWWHQRAANYLEGNIEAGDRLLDGEWTEPYFPLHAGDRETIKNSIHVYTVAQKKATFHFALAIDHALLEDFGAADKEFATAMKLQPIPEHRRLIQNRMESVVNMARMPDDSKAWLISHRIALRG
jgi:tetratricopeptide (TPR) repeat protein